MSKILIFYAKAGGGHESAAKTLKTRIESKYTDSEVIVCDVFQNSKDGYLSKFIEKAYVVLVEKLLPIWKLFLFLLKFRLFVWILKFIFKYLTFATIDNQITHFKPDIIISTYYFVADVAHQSVNQIHEQTKNYAIKLYEPKIFTVVTDIFSPNPIWFQNLFGQYIVFSDQAKNTGLGTGLKTNVVNRFGYFFDSQFDKTITDHNQINTIYTSFDLESNIQTILLVGGGSSFPGGVELFRKFLKINAKLRDKKQILIVAGRNTKLKSKLETELEKFQNQKNLVRIFGFTNQMYELINIANVVVGKGGPALVLEVLSQSKPMFISSYIPDQEKGNVDFVVNNDLGIYEPNKPKLVLKTFEYLAKPEQSKDLNTNPNLVNFRSSIDKLIEFVIKN